MNYHNYIKEEEGRLRAVEVSFAKLGERVGHMVNTHLEINNQLAEIIKENKKNNIEIRKMITDVHNEFVSLKRWSVGVCTGAFFVFALFGREEILKVFGIFL